MLTLSTRRPHHPPHTHTNILTHPSDASRADCGCSLASRAARRWSVSSPNGPAIVRCAVTARVWWCSFVDPARGDAHSAHAPPRRPSPRCRAARPRTQPHAHVAKRRCVRARPPPPTTTHSSTARDPPPAPISPPLTNHPRAAPAPLIYFFRLKHTGPPSECKGFFPQRFPAPVQSAVDDAGTRFEHRRTVRLCVQLCGVQVRRLPPRSFQFFFTTGRRTYPPPDSSVRVQLSSPLSRSNLFHQNTETAQLQAKVESSTEKLKAQYDARLTAAGASGGYQAQPGSLGSLPKISAGFVPSIADVAEDTACGLTDLWKTLMTIVDFLAFVESTRRAEALTCVSFALVPGSGDKRAKLTPRAPPSLIAQFLLVARQMLSSLRA